MFTNWTSGVVLSIDDEDDQDGGAGDGSVRNGALGAFDRRGEGGA